MKLDPEYKATLPLHIAIIMDGNGRWAKARNRPRIFGHQEGVKTVRRIVEVAADIGVKSLTLYSFSTENWTRPKAEITGLFRLLKQYVDSDLDKLNNNDVRIRIIGRRTELSNELINVIDRVEAVTEGNKSFLLNIAFNYGGRDEIMRAISDAARSGEDLTNLSEESFTSYLDTAGVPDPDLVIRTSGEKRISNFLLWQAAYSEFVFSDVLWPDFSKKDLEEAILDYQKRDRRFGSVKTAEVA